MRRKRKQGIYRQPIELRNAVGELLDAGRHYKEIIAEIKARFGFALTPGTLNRFYHRRQAILARGGASVEELPSVTVRIRGAVKFNLICDASTEVTVERAAEAQS